MRHLAAAFENDALIYAQARRENIAAKNRWTMNFDPVLGANTAIDLSTDDHDARINLSMNARALADNQGIWGVNIAAKGSTDSHRSLEAKFALEFTAMVDHACDRSVG
jgi:hypothetical protein